MVFGSTLAYLLPRHALSFTKGFLKGEGTSFGGDLLGTPFVSKLNLATDLCVVLLPTHTCKKRQVQLRKTLPWLPFLSLYPSLLGLGTGLVGSHPGWFFMPLPV